MSLSEIEELRKKLKVLEEQLPKETLTGKLEALTERFTGSKTVPGELSDWLLDERGTEINRGDKNPVEIPPSVAFGSFSASDTASGLKIQTALGERSGYYQEFENWAPVVGHLFNWFTQTSYLSLYTPIRLRKSRKLSGHS